MITNMRQAARLVLLIMALLVLASSSVNAETTPWNSRLDSLAPEPAAQQQPGAVVGGELKIDDPSAPAAATQTPAAPATGRTAAALVQAGVPHERPLITPTLKGVVLIGSADDLAREGVPDVSGLSIRGPKPPASEKLEALFESYWNKPLDMKGAVTLTQLISKHYSDHDRPFVQAVLPSGQKIADNTLQILVLEGTVGEITVTGNKYYAASQLTRQIRQRAGLPIRRSVLEEDIVWLNSPFRKVNIVAGKGAQPGTADLEITVQDKEPGSEYAGYGDTGSKVTGYSRYNAGFSRANVFERDHQLGYKYTQAEEEDTFLSHFVTYTAPIQRTRHTVNGFVTYSETRTSYTTGGLDSTTIGKSVQAGLRYTVPKKLTSADKRNVKYGVDYKKSDNAYDYIFFGTPFSGTPTTTETVQFVAGYDRSVTHGKDSGKRPGSCALDLQLIYSPGDMTADNDLAAYRRSSAFADPSYVYGKLSLNRTFQRSNGGMFKLNLAGQYGGETLLGGEQIAITGRGYDPSESSGDYGYTLNAELYTKASSLLTKPGAGCFENDQLRWLVFMDYGWAGVHNPAGGDKDKEALSAGLGLRWNAGEKLSVRLDYGWQLKDTGVSAVMYDRSGSRAHLGVSVSW